MRSIHAVVLLAGTALGFAANAQQLVFTNTNPPIFVPLQPSSTLYVVDDAGVPHFVPVDQLIEIRAQCRLDGSANCLPLDHPLATSPTLQVNAFQFLPLLEGATLEWFDGSVTTSVRPRSGVVSCIADGMGCLGFPSPPSPPIVSLSVDATEVAVGTPFTLSSAVSNATYCERSASPHVPAWSADGPPSAAVTLALSAPGSYSFQLRCYNAGGTGTNVRTVTASAAPPPACAPPAGLSRQPAPSSYPALFGAAFASTTSGTLDLAPGEYSSVAITIPAGTGGEGFFVVSKGASNAQAAMTLAPCSGDFSFATIPAECTRIGNGKVLPWRVGTAAPGVCALTPGQTYHLNTTFRDALLAPTCIGAQCRATIAQSNVSVTQPIPPLSSPLALASLGASIAVEGDVMVAGLPDLEQSTGRVYVYRRTSGPAGWTYEAELRAGDAAIGDAFGTAVSVSADGRTILVGVPFDDHGGKVDAGSARIFRMTGVSWADTPSEETLVAADAASGDRYGAAIDVSPSGTAFVIGAPEKDGGTGSAYSFKSAAFAAKSGVTTTEPIPVPRGKARRAIGDKFGAAVATDSDDAGGRWVIGLPGRDLGTGAVRTLRDVGGTFVFNEEVVAPGAQPGDGFGSALDITGNKFVAGSPGDDVDPDGVDDGNPADDVTDQGSATVFVYRGDDTPEPPQRLVAAVGNAGDGGGASVAIADGIVIVGHPLADVPGLFGNELKDSGRIDVYRLDRPTDAYTFSQSQSGEDAASGDQFGRAVASDGRTIAVGAPARAARAGAAYPLDASRSTIFGSGFEAP